MLEGIKKWAQDTKNKKYVYLVMALLILVLMITFIPLDGQEKAPLSNVVKQEETKESENVEDTLEKKLAAMLREMEGVGEVSVMITTVSNEEKVLAEDITMNVQKSEEKDQSGGSRVTENNNTSHSVVLQNGNTPYVVKEYAPIIKGVFILAEGADSSEVKAKITEAVAALLDVPIHKISVEKRK